MAISPISAISSYSYLFNISSEDDKVKQRGALDILLRQYDLIPTDNYDSDVERLRLAMIQEQMDKITEQQEQSQETEGYEERPWYEIMWQLGLHQNDSVREDYDDIMDELDYRIMNAEDEDEYNKYNDMRIRTEEYFNGYSEFNASRISVDNSSHMIGLSMLATMNMMEISLS